MNQIEKSSGFRRSPEAECKRAYSHQRLVTWYVGPEQQLVQGILASRGFLGEEEIREYQIRELQVMF